MSWYDPPEYPFQKAAEEIDSRGLFGLYEYDAEAEKIINYDRIPDEFGSKEEMTKLYDSIVEDEPEAADKYIVIELSFDACCEMAESEYEDALEAHYDYKYHAEKESQPCDYDDYY